MTAWLRGQGYAVHRKRVTRLMRQMGIEAIDAKPKLSQPLAGHKMYPYLLRGVKIERVNHVWSTEQCFEETKPELGMDHYEVRTYPGWHHHMLTCM